MHVYTHIAGSYTYTHIAGCCAYIYTRTLRQIIEQVVNAGEEVFDLDVLVDDLIVSLCHLDSKHNKNKNKIPF